MLLKYLPKLDSDIIMCTLEIESLYTNINHKQVLKSLEYFLNTRSRNSTTNFFYNQTG